MVLKAEVTEEEEIDCSLPMDKMTDLDTFNDKIAGDGKFQINSV